MTPNTYTAALRMAGFTARPMWRTAACLVGGDTDLHGYRIYDGSNRIVTDMILRCEGPAVVQAFVGAKASPPTPAVFAQVIAGLHPTAKESGA